MHTQREWEYRRRVKRLIKQKWETGRQKGEESEEVSLNWESITEACVEQPLSVSRKHTEMCSSAGGLYKFPLLQSNVLWMAGKMGLGEFHSRCLPRRLTFGPAMIWALFYFFHFYSPSFPLSICDWWRGGEINGEQGHSRRRRDGVWRDAGEEVDWDTGLIYLVEWGRCLIHSSD